MTSFEVVGRVIEACAAASAVAVAHRRPGYVSAAVALVVLAAIDLLDGLTLAALAPMPRPIEGPARVLVYLDGAFNLATSATVAGLAVTIASTPERRRRAVAIVAAAWLLASVVLAALYPSPLVRGEGLQRIYVGADLIGLSVASVALVGRGQQLWAEKRSPERTRLPVNIADLLSGAGIDIAIGDGGRLVASARANFGSSLLRSALCVGVGLRISSGEVRFYLDDPGS
jgi:hypothetical protein